MKGNSKFYVPRNSPHHSETVTVQHSPGWLVVDLPTKIHQVEETAAPVVPAPTPMKKTHPMEHCY
jgi:hypothetical protein